MLDSMETRGMALMWVPMELRTIAVCKAALENDPDAIGWVPDDKQWLGAAMEGHLLTVHCDSA